jgi:hypothetical protein
MVLLNMSLTPISSTNRHIACPIRVHDKNGRASHAAADTQANPLEAARCRERQVYAAFRGLRNGGGGRDADAVAWAIGDGGEGREVCCEGEMCCQLCN